MSVTATIVENLQNELTFSCMQDSHANKYCRELDLGVRAVGPGYYKLVGLNWSI